mgnify:CR=1 FL=1
MITILYYDDYSLLWWGKISGSSVSVCLHATEIQPWNRYCKIKISKRILKHLLMKNNAWYCLQIVISWKGSYRWFKQGRHVEITDRVCQVRNWQAPKGRVSISGIIFSSINVLVYVLRFKSCNTCSMVESQLHAYIRVLKNLKFYLIIIKKNHHNKEELS